MTSANEIDPVAVVCAFFLMLLPWASYLVWRRNRDTALPLFAMVSSAYWVYFGLAFFQGSRTILLRRPTLVSEDSVSQVMEMALVGILCLWAGMKMSFSPKNFSRLFEIKDQKQNWIYVRLVLIAGTILLFYPLSLFWFGDELRQVMEILESVIPTIAYLLLFQRYLTNRATRFDCFLLIAAAVLRIGGTLASGWMGPAVSLGIASVAMYLVERRRIPWSPISLAIVAFLFLQVGKSEYRKAYWYGDSQGHVIDRVSYWLDASASRWSEALTMGRWDKIADLAGQTMDRTSILTQSAHVMESTPSRVPFQNGTSYKFLAVTLIPRFVWPDKPSINDANRTYQLEYGLGDSRAVEATSISVGPLAEAYMNFGWVGVVCIMCGIGIILGAFQNTLFRSTGLLLVVGIALLPGLLQVDSQLGQYLGGLVQQMALAVVVFAPIATRNSNPKFVRCQLTYGPK